MVSYILIAALFILGACVGSFTSVVMYRLHSHEKGILRGRSKCPHCKVKLGALDLVPLLSYIALRGKCRSCNKEISYMYPLLELVTGALFVLLYMKFPLVQEINGLVTILDTNVLLYILHAFYVFVLVFTFFFDLHYMHVADEVMLPAILIGLLATFAAPLTPNLIDALIGGAIPVVFFALQILVSKGKWIGAGDLRIGAFMGVILGWQMTIVALIISYFLGSIVGVLFALKKGKLRGVAMPFAPMLVTGTLIALFFGADIWNWYTVGIGMGL